MKNKILGYVFLVIILAAAVGLVYWRQNPKVSNQITDNSKQDPTVNWKIYSNPQYGFEFKYPANIYAEDNVNIFSPGNGAKMIVSFYDIQGKQATEKCNCGEYQRFQVLIVPNIQKLSAFDYAKKYFPNDVPTLTEISISGLKGVGFGEMSRYVLVANNNQLFQIMPTDDILPTFKFTSLQDTIYENQYMKVMIPADWTAKQVNQGAVNITKGNYILYINGNAQQASGVEGGRFAEIAMGSPSADDVITDWPNSPCGTVERNLGTTDLIRFDLYTNNKEKNQWCTPPKDGSTVWYFSYLSGREDYYFNYYNSRGNEGMSYVITMSYNSKDVNQLPKKGSAELNQMLTEMTDIVKTLELKQK